MSFVELKEIKCTLTENKKSCKEKEKKGENECIKTSVFLADGSFNNSPKDQEKRTRQTSICSAKPGGGGGIDV